MATTTIVVTTEVELPTEVAQWQVRDLEQRIWMASHEAGRKAFEDALKQYERYLLLQHPEWERKERPVKRLATRLGEFRYERYRVWDRQQNRSRYPLDEALGLRKQSRASHDYAEQVIRQAVQRSYRQSARQMAEQTGMERSPLAQWRLIQRLAWEKSKKRNTSSIGGKTCCRIAPGLTIPTHALVWVWIWMIPIAAVGR